VREAKAAQQTRTEEFSGEPGPALPVMKKTGRKKLRGDSPGIRTITLSEEHQELRCYPSSPLKCDFRRMTERTGALNDTLYLTAPVDEKIDNASGNHYYGYRMEDRSFYLPAYRADDDSEYGLKKDLLKWSEFFTKNDRDANNDLFCDLKEEVIETIEEVSGELDGLLQLRPNGKLKQSEIVDLFDNRSNSLNRLAIERLRRLVCKHPLEWNRELYDEIKDQLNRFFGAGKCSGARETYLQNVSQAQNIWNGIKDLPHIENQLNLWFAHPVYFINHLDKCGLLEMNPYLGKSIEPRLECEHPRSIHVVDNPGFAPALDDLDHGDEERFPSGLINQGNPKRRWATVNVGFNVPTSQSYGTHMGVDLAGYKGTPIYSFITGTVWACTWDQTIAEGASRGYGRMMIIKDDNRNYLYLLAHLNAFLVDVGQKVYPGMAVAEVGNTGNSTGPHLHLEVRRCPSSRGKSDVLHSDANNRYGTGAGLRWKSPVPPYVNPFDHSEEYLP